MFPFPTGSRRRNFCNGTAAGSIRRGHSSVIHPGQKYANNKIVPLKLTKFVCPKLIQGQNLK